MKHNKVWHNIMHELVYTTDLFITAEMEKQVTEFSKKYNSLTGDSFVIDDFIRKLKGENCKFDELMKNKKFSDCYNKLKYEPSKQKAFVREEVKKWTDGHQL